MLSKICDHDHSSTQYSSYWPSNLMTCDWTYMYHWTDSVPSTHKVQLGDRVRTLKVYKNWCHCIQVHVRGAGYFYFWHTRTNFEDLNKQWRNKIIVESKSGNIHDFGGKEWSTNKEKTFYCIDSNLRDLYWTSNSSA